MKITALTLVSLISSSLFSTQLGIITSFTKINNQFEIHTSDGAYTKIIFYKSDIFRIWIGPEGIFTDPAGSEETPIVLYNDDPININNILIKY